MSAFSANNQSINQDAALGRLVSLRWLSVCLMLIVGVGSPALFGIRVPTDAILVIAGALAVWNLFTWRQPPPSGTAATLTELLVDLAAWAAFLYLTGGPTNPMASLLLPIVAVGATLLPMAHAWLIAGLAVSIYAGLWFAHRPLVLPDPEQATLWHLAGMEATFAVSAGVLVWYVSRLSDAIRRRDLTLANAREYRLRNERILALANQAASAAHELGTPLATMRLIVNELSASATEPETREDLALVDQQIEQCKAILSRLADAAGRPRASEQIRQSAFEWLEEQRNAVLAQCPDARINIIGSDGNPLILADITLNHALHNLMTNAIKASSGAPVELRLTARDQLVDILIQDRGNGIPDEIVPMNSPETRASLTGEGLGIGLLLTQAAIEEHGGSLNYQAAPDGGTIAIMTLPVAPTG